MLSTCRLKETPRGNECRGASPKQSAVRRGTLSASSFNIERMAHLNMVSLSPARGLLVICMATRGTMHGFLAKFPSEPGKASIRSLMKTSTFPASSGGMITAISLVEACGIDASKRSDSRVTSWFGLQSSLESQSLQRLISFAKSATISEKLQSGWVRRPPTHHPEVHEGVCHVGCNCLGDGQGTVSHFLVGVTVVVF